MNLRDGFEASYIGVWTPTDNATIAAVPHIVYVIIIMKSSHNTTGQQRSPKDRRTVT